MTARTLTLLLAGGMLLCACSNPAGPGDDLTAFRWRADTLSVAGLSIRGIWGTSARDVYFAGGEALAHYDGRNWRAMPLPVTTIDLEGIYGFSNEDIWVVGDDRMSNRQPPPNFLHRNLMLHYDGYQWQEVVIPDGNGVFDFLTTIWGSAPDNIWVGGSLHSLFHYDGSSWQRVTIELGTAADSTFRILEITGNRSDNAFMLGNFYIEGYFDNYFLRYDGTAWRVLGHFAEVPPFPDPWGGNCLWLSPEGTLYSGGDYGVFRWDGGQWHRILERESTVIFDIAGTSDNSILAVGQNGSAFYYDGTSWESIAALSDSEATHWRVWTDGREYYVGSEVRNRRVLYHGR